MASPSDGAPLLSFVGTADYSNQEPYFDDSSYTLELGGGVCEANPFDKKQTPQYDAMDMPSEMKGFEREQEDHCYAKCFGPHADHEYTAMEFRPSGDETTGGDDTSTSMCKCFLRCPSYSYMTESLDFYPSNQTEFPHYKLKLVRIVLK